MRVSREIHCDCWSSGMSQIIWEVLCKALSKTSYHIEASQLICFSVHSTGFYMIWVFTERYFPIGFNLLYSIHAHISKVNKTDLVWVSFKYLSLLFKYEHCELNITMALLPHTEADLGLLQHLRWSSLWHYLTAFSR